MRAVPSLESLRRANRQEIAFLSGRTRCSRCGILVGAGHLETMLRGGRCGRCNAELAREERRN